MKKSILYKEWLKTDRIVLFILLVFIGFTGYDFIALSKNASIRGWSFLWTFAVLKNSVMIENLRLLPMLAGIVLAVAQFLPETYRKRIKLTLHLPYPQWKTILVMQFYGIVVLLAIYLLQALSVTIFMGHYLVRDLVFRIVFTMLTWYCAGLCAYIWTSAIILEPSWKAKVWEFVLAAGTLSLYFKSVEAMAYAKEILPMFIVTVLMALLLVQYSIVRFKEGTHD